MPDTVSVVGTVSCPGCNLPLLSSAVFQWGAVPGWESDLGSQVIWVRDDRDRPYLPFILVWVDGKYPMWNFGDPRCRDVILLDGHIYGQGQMLTCQGCETQIAAIACRVQDGLYQSLTALTDERLTELVGRLRGMVNCIILREDGSYWPRDDWYDYKITDLSKIEGESTIPLNELPEALR